MQLASADNIVDQDLSRRRPQNTRQSMNDQQDDRMPFLQAVGRKQDAPAQGYQHEQTHSDLDDTSRVIAVGQRAGPDRADQKRDPMGDDREARQRWRLEFLENDPVDDHVFNTVGHHCQRRAK